MARKTSMKDVTARVLSLISATVALTAQPAPTMVCVRAVRQAGSTAASVGGVAAIPLPEMWKPVTK